MNIPCVNRGKSIVSIGTLAFKRCPLVTSVTIPNSVSLIGHGAFSRCTLLTNLSISDNVTYIGFGAFSETGLLSKPALYKAFDVRHDKLVCTNMVYHIGEWNECEGDLQMCENGLHFCTNIFEIFNYYYGALDKEIVICECDVAGEVLTSNTSKCCARRLKPVRILKRQEIIKLMNV